MTNESNRSTHVQGINHIAGTCTIHLLILELSFKNYFGNFCFLLTLLMQRSFAAEVVSYACVEGMWLGGILTSERNR